VVVAGIVRRQNRRPRSACGGWQQNLMSFQDAILSCQIWLLWGCFKESQRILQAIANRVMDKAMTPDSSIYPRVQKRADAACLPLDGINNQKRYDHFFRLSACLLSR